MSELPAGVNFHKKSGKYRAQISKKRRHLGYFDCPHAASEAYQAEASKRGGAVDNVDRVRRFLLANLGCSKKEVICALRLNPRTVARAIRIIRSERDHGRDH